MPLTFDQVLTLSNIQRNYNFLINEPNNDMYQYYVCNSRAYDKMTQVVLADLTNPNWGKEIQSLTTDVVDRIGLKHFPEVGVIGFWKLQGQERSRILAPVHAKAKKYSSPSLRVEDLGTTLKFTISSPTDITYMCYRIILRLGYFAEEYVTYETVYEVDKPPTTGTYDIYCVGYVNEGEAISEDSNHTTLYIQGASETWPGPKENHDLHITDIEVVDDYAVTIRRSDGFIKQTDNLIVHPVSANFDSAGYMHVVLSNGEIIISDNAVPSGGGGTTDPVKVINYEYYYATSTSTSTFSYTGQPGNQLLLFITTRGALLTPPNGWTSLGDPIQLEEPAVDYLHYIQVFVKNSTGKAETITWEQERTNGTWACCIELANAATPVIEEYTKQESVLATDTAIICQKRTNDVMIFAATAVYWINDIYEWVCSSTNIWQIPNDGVTLPRMGIFIDQQSVPTPFTVGLTLAGRYMSGFGVRIPQKESGGGTIDRMVVYGLVDTTKQTEVSKITNILSERIIEEVLPTQVEELISIEEE